MNIFQGVNLFFISLFSIYVNGIPIFTVIGSAAFFLICFVFNRGFLFFSPLVLAFFLILFFISGIGIVLGFGFDLFRLLVFLSFILIVIFIPGFLNKDRISDILTVFLLLHVCFFYFQFLSYYLFGYYFNMISVFGLESRNIGGSLQLPWGAALMRASGVFSEPGTYACFLAPMVALYSGYSASKLKGILFRLSLLSLALSLSTFGIAFFFMISVFMLPSWRIRLFSLIAGFGFSAPYFYWRFFERPAIGLDSGLGFRFEYILAAFNNFFNVEGFVFGFGGFAINQFEFSIAGADNDSGLIFYILYNFGGFAFVICLLLLLATLISKKYWSFVGLLIIFMSKISFYSYAFPFYMMFLLHRSNDSRIIR